MSGKKKADNKEEIISKLMDEGKCEVITTKAPGAVEIMRLVADCFTEIDEGNGTHLVVFKINNEGTILTQTGNLSKDFVLNCIGRCLLSIVEGDKRTKKEGEATIH